MKNLLSLFLLVSFILWILPLGVFIKPSQEKSACDGQRAMCMCHVMISKPSDKVMGFGFKTGASSNRENSSGGANYFVSAKPAVSLNLRSAFLFKDQYFSYKNPFLTSLEQVPKI